jgi:peptide/nickel transport system permease protein
MSISRTVLSRVLQAVPVLWAAATLVWFFVFLIPGDPVNTICPRCTPAQAETIREQFGLDKPVHQQYIRYLTRVIRGDMGDSVIYRRPVSEILGEAVGRSLVLALAALVVSLAAGVTLGVMAARGSTLFNALLSATTMAGITIPSYWLGLILILVFASGAGWLPISGYGAGFVILGFKLPGLLHLILPALTLGAFPAALVARVTRAAVQEQVRSGHVTAAQARGVPPRLLIWRHAFRNSLSPIVTIGGLLLATLLGGAIATETVFAWPGLGRILAEAARSQDLLLLEGGVLLLTAIFVGMNLAVDLTYAALDPRIREKGAS